MDTFKQIYSIDLFYDFYEDGYCKEIKLEPAKNTVELFNRRNILFRKDFPGKWTFWSQQQDPFREEDKVCLTMILLDTSFLYGAGMVLQGALRNVHKQGMYPSSLELSKEDLKRGEMKLYFQAKSFIWEYVFIFYKEEICVSSFFLEEKEGKIRFKKEREFEYDGKKAIGFISEKAIPLHQSYPYVLILYENVEGIRRMRLKNIDPPEPGKMISEYPERMRTIHYL